MTTPGILFFHKQKTSGRTRFLRTADGVVFFAQLPANAQVQPEDHAAAVQPHPGAWNKWAARTLALAETALAAEDEFIAWVKGDGEADSEPLPVLLIGFTGIDPPFELANRLHGEFIALTEIRGLPNAQRELLRRAYEHILG